MGELRQFGTSKGKGKGKGRVSGVEMTSSKKSMIKKRSGNLGIKNWSCNRSGNADFRKFVLK